MGRADSPLDGRMIFVVGARRSGTFWLQRIVTAHPLVAAVPAETHLFSHGIAPLVERFQQGVKTSPAVGFTFAERDVILDAVRDLCDRVFAPMLGPGEERLAERTPVHVLHVGLIAEVYPDARFVHIIRDGRDVARSLMSHRWAGDVREAAREWRDAVETARAGAPPGRLLEVRYEDLLGDPESGVREIYAFLGLPADPDAVAAAVRESGRADNLEPSGRAPGAGKWQEAFTPADLAEFEAVAGAVREDLGYVAGEARAVPPGPVEHARGRGRAALGAVRRRAGAVRARVRGRADGEPAGPVTPTGTPGVGREAPQAAHVVTALLDAMQTDPPRVEELLAPDARLEYDGVRLERPEALVAAITADPAFAGRQRQGWLFGGERRVAVVLDFDAPDGTVRRRTVAALVDRMLVVQVAVFGDPPQG